MELDELGAREHPTTPMSGSFTIGETRSSELASSIGREAGVVVVVVTIALGLLLSPGAVAS